MLVSRLRSQALPYFDSISYTFLEYVGELIYNPTVESRGCASSPCLVDLPQMTLDGFCRQIAHHRGRSYVYVLNSSLSIDSTYCGKESRFINHSENPNCVVRGMLRWSAMFVQAADNQNYTVALVNGDHRIGVFASKLTGSPIETVG